MRIRGLALAVLPCLAAAQSGPVNSGFEVGTPGQTPPGWFVPTADYAAELRRDGCAEGKGCVVLFARAAAPAQPFGNLMQTFSGIPFRGRTVRLRASIRLEPADPADRAQMWLRVDRTGRQMGFFDNMGDRPIRSSQWQAYEISGEIDADAQSINVGLMLFGKGKVWIDGLRFETIVQPAPTAQESEVRAQIAPLYARMNRGFESGRFDDILAAATPDAQVGSALSKQPLSTMIDELKREHARGVRYSWRTQIKSMRVAGAEAELSVQDEVGRISPDGRQDYITSGRDVWVKSGGEWKLKESIRTSQRAVAPKFDPEAAKPVIAELQQRAAPLAGVEAGKPFDDLAAFGRAVGDARVVALGEASHGGREFFQMKHRLLEYLVKEKGFTVFAIEANWPEALAVDRYIKTGEGDAASAIAQMYFWTWATEEVREMVEWMRRFNSAPGAHPTLTFTSFDMQTAPVAARKALEYLKNTAPDEAAKAEAAFDQLYKLAAGAQVEGAAGLARQAAEVVAVFDARRAGMEKKTTPEAWRDARQAAVIVQQACEMRTPGKGGGYRDEMMAVNFRWLLDRVHPREKVVIWAHNYHVSKGQEQVKSMGTWLRESLGDKMYIAGFAFRHGELRAIGMSSAGARSGLANHVAPPAPEGSGSAILGAAGLPLFFLDMRSVPAGGPLHRWLSQSQLFYDVGAMWNTSDAEANLQPETLLKIYDGLIFVDESHAARPLPR